MKNILNRLYENHSLIFKLVIYLTSIVAIVYFFPRGGQFKYQFQKGKVWYYDNFYAPFDFAIKKSKNEIEVEKKQLLDNQIFFCNLLDSIPNNAYEKLNQFIQLQLNNTNLNTNVVRQNADVSRKIITDLYDRGIINHELIEKKNIDITDFRIKILQGNTNVTLSYQNFFTPHTKLNFITRSFQNQADNTDATRWIAFLDKITHPNIVYNEGYTQRYLNYQLQNITQNKDFIYKGTKIISKGDIIEDEHFAKLTSINEQYDILTWNKSNFYWLIASYVILVAVVLLMLLLFINKYRPDVGVNNSKLSFLFSNIFLFVLITTLVLKFDSKYLYVVPYALLPLIIKAFLDPRLGLFTHVLTILLLGFIVPNSFEFIFIQIIAGIVTILTVSELYKRANLFLSVLKIMLVYVLIYVAFSITHEGNLNNIEVNNIYMLLLNGLLTATLIVPMIFFYESFFGLVSDETLREFSDTNHKLLKELNEKAPGTFQHSMQVANLAEEAAKEINANALLVRTGAMYHDIGKIYNPMYFVENQSTGVNPHTELDPEESAQIIIDHVNLGIELAKKNKLPDRVIDFIRTHHGTNLVYYFYKKEEEYNPNATDINKFRYPGPIPFSKETAIVMICDATEAASKSLKEPTAKYIDMFVDKIVKSQMDNGQFQNADITFKEIEKVKKVVKKKLKNIYHIRIEYPE